MSKFAKWQIEKNRLDMDFQQLLQKYQVISGAIYAVPLSILAIFLSQGFTTNNFIFGALISFFTYMILFDIQEKVVKQLGSLKTKVTKLGGNV